MKKGSARAPFLFLWRIISYLPRKLWNSIITPTPRGKVRWAFLGILVLALLAAKVDYPKGYNQLVNKVNAGVAQIPFLNQWQLDSVQEEGFNLGLDLQGGAHLVYEANLEELQGEDTAEAMERLRDRIERRVNGLGVSEPLVQVVGDNRLVVELAGVDVTTAIDQIGETPLLEFREPNDEPARELTEDERKELDEYNTSQQTKAEEAYRRVTSGSEGFEDVAKEVSEDPETKASGGDLGTITRASDPELYESAQDARIGRVVEGVVSATKGFYILRIDDRREIDKEMQLSHILICYEGAARCDATRSRDEAKAMVEQVRSEVAAENFSDKAKEFSDDPASKETGGDLSWVSPATTVADFEEPAKALSIGEISQPVETDFGFHIIYKRNERPYSEIDLHGIFFDRKEEADYLPAAEQWKNAGLTGSNVADAQLVFHPQTNAPQVSIQFDEEGTKKFAELTKKYFGKEIAIYLDGRPISIPTVQQEITNGQAVITGSFSVEGAKTLARSLKDGALPVTVDLIQQQTVGASLGQDSLQKSLRAGLIGLLVVALFMLLYYRVPGALAVIALCVYGLVTLMLFKVFGVTLTLAGMAGFVLSMGMAVDANVLVFERFREELASGKDMQDAIMVAFDRAWPSIRDGNVSTLLTCLILSWFGTTLIQGFAITLAIGILVSMFSAIVVTKTFMRLVLGWGLRRFEPLFLSGIRLSKVTNK